MAKVEVKTIQGGVGKEIVSAWTYAPPSVKARPHLATATKANIQSEESHRKAGHAPMKILVVATPKSGNHWLKALLSEIYDAPLLGSSDWGTHGHWVGHEHFRPADSMVEWMRRDGIVPVTITRHPFDVIVSLYHYVMMKTEPNPNERPILRDVDGMGEGTLSYVRSEFYPQLLISQLWRSIGAPSVRYEDLLEQPVETLRDLTRKIAPVDDDVIHLAISSCTFSMMRESFAGSPSIRNGENFYRSGASGYRSELSPEIAATLSSGPFAALMAAQGYQTQVRPTAPFDLTALDPFQGHRSFSNGVRISPRLYKILIRVPSLTKRWPRPWDVKDSQCLYNWLNEPFEGRPITNLMMLIYSRRPDVAKTFPLDTASRDLALWFLSNAASEYDLGPEFLQPVFAMLPEPATLPTSTAS